MKNLKQKCSSKKLLHKFAESFCITESIEKQTYYFYLFIIYQIHNTFHVSYLESYRHKKNNSEILYFLTSELIDEKEEYEVKEILRKQC